MIMYEDGNIKSYILTNNNNVIILNGRRESFRCKQRDESYNNKKFKFISYKKMLKESKRKFSRVYGPYIFDSKSRL